MRKIYRVFNIYPHIYPFQDFSFPPVHSNCDLMSLTFSLEGFLQYFLKGKAVMPSITVPLDVGITHYTRSVESPLRRAPSQSSRPGQHWQGLLTQWAGGDGSSPRRQASGIHYAYPKVQQFSSINISQTIVPLCSLFRALNGLVSFIQLYSCFLGKGFANHFTWPYPDVCFLPTVFLIH